jgi:hypothetical protein
MNNLYHTIKKSSKYYSQQEKGVFYKVKDIHQGWVYSTAAGQTFPVKSVLFYAKIGDRMERLS